MSPTKYGVLDLALHIILKNKKEKAMEHNINYIDDCKKMRKELEKNPKFKTFRRKYILKHFVTGVVAFIVFIGLFTTISANGLKSDFLVVVGICLLILTIAVNFTSMFPPVSL